jgi:hypothetical protein
MSATDNHRDQASPAAAQQLSWFDLEPADFDSAAPLVQGALFAKPDSMGTPALFGDLFGTDL